jgi:tRNA-modifying protein YgfZ
MTATSSTQTDYSIVTEGCGLLDRSERGKLALTGADIKQFLQGQVTNDIVSLRPGAGCYAAFLTPKGKMLGDLRVLDAGDELLLDTERITLQELFNMIRRFSLGYQVELHKRTLESGLLSLIGPGADTILTGLGATLPPEEHQHAAFTLNGGPTIRAIRTYLGVDLLCATADVPALRDAALALGAAEVSQDAAECLRIEHGRPRYGVDLDDSVIPQEAGLNERAVSFTKGCYVGQETVARLYYRGKPNRELRGLKGSSPLASGLTLTSGDREVGTITSAVVSPRLGPVALALVRREAPPGSVVQAGPEATAEVVALPFG